MAVLKHSYAVKLTHLLLLKGPKHCQTVRSGLHRRCREFTLTECSEYSC